MDSTIKRYRHKSGAFLVLPSGRQVDFIEVDHGTSGVVVVFKDGTRRQQLGPSYKDAMGHVAKGVWVEVAVEAEALS